jgi:hypothetical protein
MVKSLALNCSILKNLSQARGPEPQKKRKPIAVILRMEIFFLRPMCCIHGTGKPPAFAQKYYERSGTSGKA